jgi:hypothetical protein
MSATLVCDASEFDAGDAPADLDFNSVQRRVGLAGPSAQPAEESAARRTGETGRVQDDIDGFDGECGFGAQKIEYALGPPLDATVVQEDTAPEMSLDVPAASPKVGVQVWWIFQFRHTEGLTFRFRRATGQARSLFATLWLGKLRNDDGRQQCIVGR